MQRHQRCDTTVRRLDASDGGAINPLEFELVPMSALRNGDLILYAAGDLIPPTGEVVEGVASMDEAGTRVLSGWVAVRLTSRMWHPTA